MNMAVGRLAEKIHKDWNGLCNSTDAFSSIAAKHLAAPLGFDVDDLIGDLCAAKSFARQRQLNQSFGQPSVTLYSSEAFEIEALFWHTGTPAIHQHAFDGAFRLLVGRSAHCRYSFEPERQLDRLTVGRLEATHFEILTPNDCTAIEQGASLIHSAFHIDSPSVTLVARTHQNSTPELTYLPPGVAYDTAVRTPLQHKKLQLLDTLAMTSHPSYRDAVRATIAAGDLYDGLAVLTRTGGHAIDEEDFRGFADRLRAHHSDRAGIDTVIGAGFAERRRSKLVQLRQAIIQSDARVFLAALLCHTERGALIGALSDYAGGIEAAYTVIADAVGHLLGGSDDRQALIRAAASSRLAGHPVASFVQQVATMQGAELSEPERVSLERFYEQLRRHWLLTPLFDEPHAQPEPAYET